MKTAEERRIYQHKGWEYLLDDDDHTAWITKGHIGRRRRFRVPDHVMIEGQEYTITSIELFAFKWKVRTLRHLVIPDTVTYVDEDVFNCHPNLRSVYLGKGVEHIDDWLFRCNPRLTNLDISKDNPHLKVANKLILTGDGKTVLRTHHHCATYTIPEGVENVYERAFWENPKLTHVNFPSTLKTIGSNAFGTNPNLRRIKIPEGISTIGSQCFMECENLEYVELPSTLDEVGWMVFGECPRLKSLVLWSDSVMENRNGGLDRAFGNLPADCTIYVPYSLVEDYSVDEFWGKYTIRICQVGGRYDCDYDGPLDEEPEGDLIDMKMQLHQAFHEFLDCRKAHPSAPRYRWTQLVNGYESTHYDLEQWRKDEPDAQVFALLDAVVRMRDAVDLKIMHLNRRGECPDMQGKIWV